MRLDFRARIRNFSSLSPIDETLSPARLSLSCFSPSLLHGSSSRSRIRIGYSYCIANVFIYSVHLGERNRACRESAGRERVSLSKSLQRLQIAAPKTCTFLLAQVELENILDPCKSIKCRFDTELETPSPLLRMSGLRLIALVFSRCFCDIRDADGLDVIFKNYKSSNQHRKVHRVITNGC